MLPFSSAARSDIASQALKSPPTRNTAAMRTVDFRVNMEAPFVKVMDQSTVPAHCQTRAQRRRFCFLALRSFLRLARSLSFCLSVRCGAAEMIAAAWAGLGDKHAPA